MARSSHCQSSTSRYSGGQGVVTQLGCRDSGPSPGQPEKVTTTGTSSCSASRTVVRKVSSSALARAAIGVQRVAVARQGADGQPGVGDPLPVGLGVARAGQQAVGVDVARPGQPPVPSSSARDVAQGAHGGEHLGKGQLPEHRSEHTQLHVGIRVLVATHVIGTRKGCNRFQRDLIPRDSGRARGPDAPAEGRDRGPGTRDR